MNFLNKNKEKIMLFLSLATVFTVGIIFEVNIENWIMIIILVNIIGWEFSFSILKSPSTLKRILANWYSLFIHSIYVYRSVPGKFISFTMLLGAFLGRKLVKIWSFSYIKGAFFIGFSSFLGFLISFSLLYNVFLLSLIYPFIFGQYLINFLKRNASGSVLELIGLKYTVKRKVFRRKKKTRSKKLNKRINFKKKVFKRKKRILGYYKKTKVKKLNERILQSNKKLD